MQNIAYKSPHGPKRINYNLLFITRKTSHQIDSYFNYKINTDIDNDNCY